MRFQKATQAITLATFVVLLLAAAYPYREGLGVDFFLRLDPLIGLATSLAARAYLPYLLPGLIVLGSALLFGRFFCGHICPMGTTLDVLQTPVTSRRSVKDSTFEATSAHRRWKYLLLTLVLGAALAGVSLVYVGSPLSLVTRFYGLCLFPVATLLAESGLAVGTPWFLKMGFHQLAYLQLSSKVFATNLFVAFLFLGIVMASRWQPRFWCRNLCPSGALLGLCSRSPMVRRRVDSSCTRCGMCIRQCPTGAIGEDPSQTKHSECIVCLQCVKVCPEAAISFGVATGDSPPYRESADPTRRGIIVALAGGLFLSGLLRTGIRDPGPRGKEMALVDPELIRPPGALPEPEFLARCVRCGECMKACPTNTLQPVWLKAGTEGLFSPIMVPRLAACAVGCNVCGKVCPTGAIRELDLQEKQHAKVGTAYILRRNCLVWEQDRKCLVCDEVCPYNAVSFRPVPERRNAAPFVIENRCLGCGWCELRCPVKGGAAIRVNIIGEVRLASGSYVQKAREYGLVFKAKDNSVDRLAPGTFEGALPEPIKKMPKTPRPPEREKLPPGFITK
jgi:MauM/NapG family ferredoxin protein